MLKTTITAISGEIDWMRYELTRQSTTVEQEEVLKEKRDLLKVIRDLCIIYNDKFNPPQSHSVPVPFDIPQLVARIQQTLNEVKPPDGLERIRLAERSISRVKYGHAKSSK